MGNKEINQDHEAGKYGRVPGENRLLKLQGVTKRFPGVTALDKVDFDLFAGEVHVLFGENGSGKSTLVNVISGTYPRDSGIFSYLGQDITAWSPQQARAAGVSPVFQEFSLAPDLSVEDNLFLGRERHRAGILAKRRMRKKGRALLNELGFHVNPASRLRYLSRADQQMTEIAKALLQEVCIFILDEPTASLTERETARLFELIEELKAKGVGIIYVSHRMTEIRLLGDRITVLRDGQKIGTLESGSVTDNELVEMMTGRKVGMLFPKIEHRPGPTVLEVKSLEASGRLSGVDLYLREGEITGIAGLAGSCKSDVLRAVFGLLQLDGGKIIHMGVTIDDPRPLEMLKRGVIYLPSDRAAEGVALPRPVRENASMAALDMPAFSIKGLLKLRGERLNVRRVVNQLQIRPSKTSLLIKYLSGGNQQKVMLLRGLIRGATVFLLDDPTVGIDVGAKKEVYNFLQGLVENEGAAVLFISSELPELLNLCNRLYVARNNRLVAEFTGEDITEENVLKVFFKLDEPLTDHSGDAAAKDFEEADMTTPQIDYGVSPPKQGTLPRLAGRESLPFLAATALLFIFFSLVEPRFLRAYNLVNILRNSSYLIIISLGQMLALIVGGFDLAVGAVIALASITTALTMVNLLVVFPDQIALVITLGLLTALAVGATVGLVNGLCVAWLNVPPFIVTLGTMSVATGVALYITNGIPVYGMPDEFIVWFGRLRWLGMPIPIYIAAVISLAMWWLMNWTLLGRYMYAIGGNPHASRVSGIRVNIHTATAYILCGVLAALTGVLLTARVGSGEATMGGEMIMQSIAAAVIGGVSIGGGVGRVELVALGAVFLILLTNGMNLIQVDSKFQTIVVGVIMIIAVAIDQFRRRRHEDYLP